MKITFITNDNSKYLYKIIRDNNVSSGYKSWLETIEGNGNAEFSSDIHRPMNSIMMLKSILNEKGIIIEHVESVEDSFHPKESFIDLVSKIEG